MPVWLIAGHTTEWNLWADNPRPSGVVARLGSDLTATATVRYYMFMTYYDMPTRELRRPARPKQADTHPYYLLTVDTLLAIHSDLVERHEHYPVGFEVQHLTIDANLPVIEMVLHMRGVHVARTVVDGRYVVEVTYESNWTQR